MTPNGRLEEVVEALLKRVEVLEEKAGIRNSNIIKNPKLMVVDTAVEAVEAEEKEPYRDTVEPVEHTPEEVEEKQPIEETDTAVETEDETKSVEYEPTEDSKIEPVEEKSKKNTKKSKK